MAHNTAHAKCELRGACSVGGRPILHEVESARAARHESRTRWSNNVRSPWRHPAVVLVQSGLSRRLGEERASRWVTTQPHQVRTARRVLRGRLADTLRDRERAGRAPWKPNAVLTNVRSPCRRPVAVLVHSSLSRWLGEERASRWATTQPRQVRTARRELRRQSADTPWDVKRAGHTELERAGHDIPKPVPPTCRGVAVVDSRPMARGGARVALVHNTTTPSPHCAARAPWAVGRFSATQKRAGRAPRK